MKSSEARGYFSFLIFHLSFIIFHSRDFTFSVSPGLCYRTFKKPSEGHEKAMNITDNDIIRLMGEDPEEGIRALMRKYGQPVYWHIRRLVVAHADAEDAAQETFIRIYKAFPNRDKGSSLTAWIYRIATNEALRLIERRKKTRPSVDIEGAKAALPFADEYVDYSDLEAVRLQKAILSLPEKQQIAFNMRYYDGMSYDEIAAVAGSSAASAKQNYHVAKQKIVEYMNQND